MKKIITLCFFAFALLIGTQTAIAQTDAELNKKATAKTKELASKLKIDNDNIGEIYNAYKDYESKMYSISQPENKVPADEVALVKSTLQSRIKNALTEAQYKRYLIIVEYEENLQSQPEAKAVPQQHRTK
mgnify:CR=1 FL=1